MKRFLSFCTLLIIATALFAVSAKNYLVNPSLGGMFIYDYKGETFYANSTAFTSFSKLLANKLDEDCKIYVLDGTYNENITINTKGAKIIGFNANMDSRTVTRSAETIFTGKISVAAEGVEINGCSFTGNGCVTLATSSHDFKFLYNRVYGSTITRDRSHAVVMVGLIDVTASAKTASSQQRYKNVTIAHNEFTGGSGQVNSNFIQIGGSYGVTDIYDNTFYSGGESISVGNTQGAINIFNNNFTKVGVDLKADGGAFCIFLNRIAQANSTTVNINSNDFNECIGETSLYPVIRFFQGDSSSETSAVKPVNCALKVNYNIFRNRGEKLTTSEYNYIFFANKDYTAPATVDTRFNQFDNVNHYIGMVQQPWATSQVRYSASNYGEFDYGSAAGTTMDYYLKTQKVNASTRVMQSFDIDELTGDIYFIQINPNLSGYESSEPMTVTRLTKDGKQTQMHLDNSGHGSNMCISHINGQVWIWTGGAGKVSSSGSHYSTDLVRFPFVAGAKADLKQGSTSFSYSGKTYQIVHFKNKEGYSYEYPAIDEHNNLLLDRSASGDIVHLEIFDLSEVVKLPSSSEHTTLEPIKSFNMTKYLHANSSYLTDAAGKECDKGFGTWDPQGFTILGDYLYFCEGVGKDASNAMSYTVSGKVQKVPTIWIHVHNWRKDEFEYRKPVLKSVVLNLDYGEPEGLKMHKDNLGVNHMYLGVMTGASGSRTGNIFEYTLNESESLNNTWSKQIAKADFTPSASALTIQAIRTPQSSTLTLTNTLLNGEYQFTIAGPDAEYFSVQHLNKSASNIHTSVFYPTTEVSITFTPGTEVRDYFATLRISTPYGDDKRISLTGRQSSGITAVTTNAMNENILWDGNVISAPEGTTSIEVYSASGAKVATSKGTPIVLNASGIYIVRCVTPNGIISTKINK